MVDISSNNDSITAFCKSADLTEQQILQIVQNAQKWRIPILHAISIEDYRSEVVLYWNIAQSLDIPYCGKLKPCPQKKADISTTIDKLRRVIMRPGWNWFIDDRFPNRFVVAPKPEEWSRFLALLKAHPQLKNHISLTCPTNLRRAAALAFRADLLRASLSHLENIIPGQSAITILTKPQTKILLMLLLVLCTATLLSAKWTWFILSFCLALFFVCVIALRIVAIRACFKTNITCLPPLTDENLPSYTILVPLHQENKVAKKLISNLKKINYPKERLDIKIILEENDPDTRRIVDKYIPGSPFEVIIVPSASLQTKPRALNYALNFTNNDLICIFDAEDDPDSNQLRHAAALLLSDTSIGAVQCVLSIRNGNESWLSRLFAIEYNALFKGLLPVLSSLKMPIPLGGTSNHFRREVLEKMGAWDPYNVTEDADLGIRLARCGYRCAILENCTIEEAPIYFRQWLPQRTRWFKGWVQSWLVHMRAPRKLVKDLGWRNFAAMHIVLAGMFVSAALHPFFAIIALYDLTNLLVGFETISLIQKISIGLNLFNLVAGYTAAILLSASALLATKQSQWLRSLWLLPLYWWLLTIAAWRAVWQLIYAPYKWEKTEHGVSRVKG